MNVHRKPARLLVAVGAVVVATVLAACSGTSDSSGGPTSLAGSPAGAASIDVGTGKITPKNVDRIAYLVQAGKTFSYTAAQAQGAQDAAKELGVRVDVYWSNLDAATELANFQQAFTGGKHGGILVQSVNTQLCKTVENDSVARGVLVMVVGNPLCGQATAVGEDLWSPGTISYVGGQNGVDGITNLLKASASMVSGPQRVMLALGLKGHPSTVAWEEAFKRFQNTDPDWTLANTTYTDFTTPGAFSAVQNALQSNKDITVAYSLYVDVTAGVAKAIEAQGLKDQISLFENGGGSKVSVQLIEEGKEKGSLPVYPYSLGYNGVKTMVAALKGTQPPKFIPNDGNPDTATPVITSKELATFKPQW